MGFSSDFAVLRMFLQILTFLLKFRTLLSICLSLSCCFLGTPLKWFTLSCSSVRIALTLFLLQPQHPASWYGSAWVDPASVEHPWICLLEQCGFDPKVLHKLFKWQRFQKERVFLHIYRDYCLSFYLSYGTELSPIFSWFFSFLWWILILPLLGSSALQSVQNSHRCPCL